MDSNRFEHLTRTLSSTETRRGAVKTLAAASLGLGLTRLGMGGVRAGKKNKHKDKNKNKDKGKDTDKDKDKPTFTTVRQPLTQTFSSSAAIAIPSSGVAAPYPSSLAVSGFANGSITDVNLTVNGFTHTFADDVDILLAKGSSNLVVMSDAGGNNAASNLTLIFDDAAAAPLPDATALVSGAFLPTNHLLSGGDTFPAPAPAVSANVLLSAFNGIDPNGEWQLFVTDDLAGGTGSISSWSLEITADVDVQVQEQVDVPKDKKKRKKGGKKGKR